MQKLLESSFKAMLDGQPQSSNSSTMITSDSEKYQV